MSKTKINKKEYILYLLNKLPAKTDKYRINKIAFLIEFAYIYKNSTELTDTVYAAITKGPVVNDYKELFKDMQQEGSIKIEGHSLRPLQDADVSNVNPSILEFIDEMVEKYSRLGTNELIALTHSLDSYVITTQKEKLMGNIIDKSLAHLDIYFDDNLENYEDELILDDKLPKIDRSRLLKYDLV